MPLIPLTPEQLRTIEQHEIWRTYMPFTRAIVGAVDTTNDIATIQVERSNGSTAFIRVDVKGTEFSKKIQTPPTQE